MTFSRPARGLLIGVAVCLAVGLTAGPALAAATWTIRPGGAIRLGPGSAKFTDTKTGDAFTCTAVSLTGRLKSGSGLTGTGAGSLTGGTIGGCSISVQVTVTLLDLPWHINLVSYDASTRLVHGTISHMELSVAAPGCSYVIDGTRGGASDGMVKFTYSDSTHRVKTSGGNLHTFNVSGCFGLINNGDPVTLTASLPLTPAQSITSP